MRVTVLVIGRFQPSISALARR